MQTDPKPGTLYVVGTPIGNLEDITFRAVRILQTVDIIAAEDTRHTGKLLQHFQVKTPQVSYHEHNRTSRIPELLEHLVNNKAIALVSDAGMPGISDPGYELVKACIEAGIPVVPIPGASAAITALSAAGLPTDRFVFEGFLPAKTQQRQEHLESLQTESRTLIFYESPHRLRDTLQDLAEIWGSDRQIVLGRELTKLYEEFWRGTIAEAIAYYSQREPQGEYTLVVAGIPASQPQLTEQELKAELKQLISQGISRSQASRQLAKFTSLPRRQLYQLALSIVSSHEP
ncbi:MULTISPECIES: 16S rRNA (cytidine(1402)-2'-O)-methyltransferase [unclassified Nostoc]|uniref:16S rRNA (cytidine(1402)-2'-O)-methyltransferase n=1 Tax=unclassified Nostoc TaxID=2593658 RepID=UPI0025AAA90C|nr:MULTISPECIES: 16S rRNA (cytidine(1402)-2'-O)-methyltransferase [unclassified Nostoc]MDM9582540.1 16S rRNA (cytidine(1402)-2'-O)-methyltransferase [Nostoc sp. GT001]MDZ7944530.1 16S rRNA (cytidine(1402)-2'-O)-methyltransferase [Nostoc sp. EfeVER01]MDZ7992206.1 16S rRNA (cytidine(1402)-2'-O)-methyltransferase [Nostoc sp. EspVER01]